MSERLIVQYVNDDDFVFYTQTIRLPVIDNFSHPMPNGKMFKSGKRVIIEGCVLNPDSPHY